MRHVTVFPLDVDWLWLSCGGEVRMVTVLVTMRRVTVITIRTSTLAAHKFLLTCADLHQAVLQRDVLTAIPYWKHGLLERRALRFIERQRLLATCDQFL